MAKIGSPLINRNIQNTYYKLRLSYDTRNNSFKTLGLEKDAGACSCDVWINHLQVPTIGISG